MKVIEWLLKGNPNVTYCVNKQLLNNNLKQDNDGYISDYLRQYNYDTKMWGNGLYGPKWISSTYTLLDLVDLNAAPDQRMIDAYHKLRKELVLKYTLNPNDEKTLDLCIVGMLLRIGSYLKTNESNLKELIDFILYTMNEDGAWNCYFNYRKYHTSSLHTTINILEGLIEYTSNGYDYRIDEVRTAMNSSHEFILKKKLFRSRRTGEIISESFTKIHYPTRWFYDMYRALEHFVNASVPYDERMSEGLERVKKYLVKGPLPKGRTYAGRMHFKYDLEDYKRLNTLRALKIVKFYDADFYDEIIGKKGFKKSRVKRN